MTISLGVVTPSQLVFPIFGGRYVALYSGFVNFNLKGGGQNVSFEDVEFVINTSFRQIEQLTANAALSSIRNVGAAVDSAWSVDSARAQVIGTSAILFRARLGISDIDGYLNGISYQVNVVGIF